MKIFSTWGEHQGIGGFVLRADNVVCNSGKDIYVPDWMTSVEALPMLVIRISKVAKSVEKEYAERYFDRVSLAFTFRAEGLAEGYPERMREDFDGSFVRWSDWVEVDNLRTRHLEALKVISPTELSVPAQLELPTDEMIADAIALVSQYYLLKVGDWVALPALMDGWSVAPGNGLIMYEGEDKKELIYVGIK